MKFKFSPNILYTLIAGLIIFLVVKSQIHYTSGMPISFFSWKEFIEPIDKPIPETLPYGQYIKQKDSITTLRNLKNGDIFEFDGDRFDCIGVFTNISCDTCSLKWYHSYRFNDKRFMQNYIKLYNWKLGIDERLRYVDSDKFYVNNGQGFVRRSILDTARNKDGSLYEKVNIKDIPVKFRYSHKDNCLMIPISHSTAQLLETMVKVIGILILTYFLFLIRCFFRFIIDLSRGYSFTAKNIFRLKLIGISLFAFPILMFLFNYLLRIIFNTYFTINVIFNNDVWNSNSSTILEAGCVFLLLFNAFRQGKKLQEEQDLTV
jgi:hypothetical protein